MAIRHVLFYLISSLNLAAQADPRHPLYGPFETFKTEPTFRVHSVNVSITPSDPALLSPGYYFIVPNTLFATGFGPHIIDQFGQLVWYGNESTISRTVDFYSCNYGTAKSGSHLCITQGHNVGTEVQGSFASVLDETYSQISPNFTYDPSHPDYLNGEGHEFNMLASGEAYITAVTSSKPTDLTPVGGVQNGVVKDACWQHIDVPTYRESKPLFTWCALDPGHLQLWDTEVYLNLPSTVQVGNYTDGAAGRGTETRPWDLFHQNSIDPDHDGNYLVSLRHADQILLVAGPNTTRTNVQPGDIIWRLGGRSENNDFTMVKDWTFSRQHHIRYLSSNETHLTVSLFNNGWTQRTEDGLRGRVSSGQIISLDNSTMMAHLVHEYPHPFGTASNVSIAQGATQLLPDGNVVVGWGSVPELTEYTESGEVLWHARFAGMQSIYILSYRAYKFPWTGLPKYPPKMLAYREHCSNDSAPLLAYVSWNGATEVTIWRFWVRFGWLPFWLYAGHEARNGFETRAEIQSLAEAGWSLRIVSTILKSHWTDVYVQGIDSHGRVLGFTAVSTFVPDLSLSEYCDAGGCTCSTANPDNQGCTADGQFLYEAESSRGLAQCNSSSSSVAVIAGLVVLLIILVFGTIRILKSNHWRGLNWKLTRIRQLLARRKEYEYAGVPLDDYTQVDERRPD